MDFNKFLSSEEEQKKRVMASANPPTLESLYTDTDLVKKYPYLPTLVKVIKTAKPRPKVVEYGDLTLAIQDAAYGALQGQPNPRLPWLSFRASWSRWSSKTGEMAPRPRGQRHRPRLLMWHWPAAGS